jgi:hypothetical protein
MKGALYMNGASQKNRTLGLCLALLAWFSVLMQCYLSLQLAALNGKSIGSGLEVFFSYFTVLTNLLICVSLTLSVATPSSTLGRWFSRPSIVTGIATSIAFVGLSYHFLLRHTWNPQGARLVADVLLHYVVPALYVLYWWFTASKSALGWVCPLTWSIYPTVYLVCALIRGSIIGSYPYPFIDAAALGYGRTMQNAFGLLFVFTALGCLFVALSRRGSLNAHLSHRESP